MNHIEILQSYIELTNFFKHNSTKFILESTYGREFDERDSYYIEKVGTYERSIENWLGQLDSSSMLRLVMAAKR
jgi:hypothetical protein